MRVKNLFLYCHNIFSVNELFTELCFRGWFRIEKEPLLAFALDHFCRGLRQGVETLAVETLTSPKL
jgi:hypothetical protein